MNRGRIEPRILPNVMDEVLAECLGEIMEDHIRATPQPTD